MGTKQLASSYNEDMGSLEVINDRMKEELQSLLINLESHLEKAKENKRRYLEAKMQTDGLYNKDEDLYSAQNNVNKLEKDIKRMKRDLNRAYGIDKIITLENELAQYNKEAKILEKDTLGLRFIKNAHIKARKEIDANLAAKSRYSNLKEETDNTKRELKEKLEELKERERLAAVEHQQVIELENQCRKLNQLLRDHNRGEQVIPGPVPDISENDIQDLENEIEKLSNLRASEEQKYKKMHKKYQTTLAEKTQEVNDFRRKVKEKEQECKLGEFKINQFRRSIPRNTLLQMNTTAGGFSTVKIKGSSTQYHKTLKSSRMAFNSTEFTESKEVKGITNIKTKLPSATKKQKAHRYSLDEKSETKNITKTIKKNRKSKIKL
ncbi:unnamed protein product [Moneuplotes crassus]|uniref:Uncharacterized protein n=1 Tax=Euplotes crassus TaxID=5936 RepID=A0AAD1XCI4_EUPCR|nr:unnamed protein product [Moneuplotes crassus]